jgi:hypothetical protein
MFFFDYKTAYPNETLQIPKSTLGYTTNNLYPCFPPLMSDGRSVLSSWTPESTINNKIKTDNSINSNSEYRKYLTTHATEIMKMNFIETANDTGYMFVSKEYETSKNSNTINSYNSVNEQTKPIGYIESDLKNAYLTKMEINN